MDSSSFLNKSNVSEKYSGLDESLQFVKSLVSHRVQEPSFTEEMNKQEAKSNGHAQVNGNNKSKDIDLNKSIVSITSSQNGKVEVEERLYMMNDLYKQRREQKLKTAEEEKAKAQANIKPYINKKSQQLLKNKNKPGTKVEDRLMGYAKKKDQKENTNESENINKRYPKNSFCTNDFRQNSKHKHNITNKHKNPKASEVVSRLMDYGNLYKQKKLEKEEQVKMSQTFKPNISKSSQLVQTKSRYNSGANNAVATPVSDNHVLLKYTQSQDTDDIIPENGFNETAHSRLYDVSPIKEPTKKMQMYQDAYDKNHPFYPTINKRSKEIIDNKKKEIVSLDDPTAIHNRLFSLSQKKQQDPEKVDFKPQLNKNSEEIIRLMREGNDYDKDNRWRSLYDYGVEKQIMRKHIEDKVKEVKEKDELESYPYKPQILDYQKSEGESQSDIVARTLEWAASLECKKEVMTESYQQQKMMKELQE